MRRHLKDGLTIAENYEDILRAIDYHCQALGPKVANQTHSKYWSYDISCNEDFALHAKFHNWTEIFQFFVGHPYAMGTFATKNVNKKLLEFNPKEKIRIRFSLMPQELSSILEPSTSLIEDRIQAINLFKEAGYDVHINFSPVILYKSTYSLYESSKRRV
jgi:spore photoproduct lyase